MSPLQLFIFTKVIRCSRLPLSVGFWSILNLHVLDQGMCVLLFDVFKLLLLRTTDVLKTCPKSKFLRKKI